MEALEQSIEALADTAIAADRRALKRARTIVDSSSSEEDGENEVQEESSMLDLPKFTCNLDDAKDLLQCPICFEYFDNGQYVMCPQAHLICNVCFDRMCLSNHEELLQRLDVDEDLDDMHHNEMYKKMTPLTLKLYNARPRFTLSVECNCPLCRQPINAQKEVDQASDSYKLINAFRKIFQTRCDLCKKQMNIMEAAEHTLFCSYRMIHCPIESCTHECKVNDFPRHAIENHFINFKQIKHNGNNRDVISYQTKEKPPITLHMLENHEMFYTDFFLGPKDNSITPRVFLIRPFTNSNRDKYEARIAFMNDEKRMVLMTTVKAVPWTNDALDPFINDQFEIPARLAKWKDIHKVVISYHKI